MKHCSKCKVEKPFTEFYLVKGKPGSWCKPCQSASNRSYRLSDRGKVMIKAARSATAAKVKKAEADRLYRLEQGDALKAKKRVYYQANKERIAAKAKQTYAADSSKAKLRSAKWKSENKAQWNAKCMERYTQKIKARPAWLSEDDLWLIAEAYDISNHRTKVFGFEWNVDHIVPLRGKTVCGLHVPWNLQVVPASYNCSKRNDWE